MLDLPYMPMHMVSIQAESVLLLLLLLLLPTYLHPLLPISILVLPLLFLSQSLQNEYYKLSFSYKDLVILQKILFSEASILPTVLLLYFLVVFAMFPARDVFHACIYTFY